MKFKCEIDMDNAAFEINPFNEIDRIIGKVLVAAEQGIKSGNAMDTNGNRVCKWEITD